MNPTIWRLDWTARAALLRSRELAGQRELRGVREDGDEWVGRRIASIAPKRKGGKLQLLEESYVEPTLFEKSHQVKIVLERVFVHCLQLSVVRKFVEVK